MTYAAEEAVQRGEALQGQADAYIVRLSDQLRTLDTRLAASETERARLLSSTRAFSLLLIRCMDASAPALLEIGTTCISRSGSTLTFTAES